MNLFMIHFLVDANLPYYFSLRNTPDQIYQLDIQYNSDDYEIWQYAKERNLTIITDGSTKIDIYDNNRLQLVFSI